MRIGLSTSGFYGRFETEEAAEYIAALPVDCAEAFLQTPSEYTLEFAALVRRSFGRVHCTSVHPMGIQFENSMMSRSKRQRQDAFDLFCRVLDAGKALGAGTYVYHGRSSAQLSPLPWDLQKNLDVLGPMCELAAQREMVIGWENVCWCQLTTPQRVREAAAALDAVRFTLDIKQAMRAGCDPMDFVAAMGGRLVNVHICDWREDGGLCLPGEGCFDFGALFTSLAEAGYDGPVIIEPYLRLIKSEDALLASIRSMRALLEPSEKHEGGERT